jgi:FAD/FMN-containing dehydrogenase
MGGAVGRMDASETAFGERAAPYLVSVGANWTDPTDSVEQVQWVRSLWQELSDRWGAGSGYLNFASGDEGELAADAAGALAANLKRLAEVKAAYDPTNFFRRNNNIAPAS